MNLSQKCHFLQILLTRFIKLSLKPERKGGFHFLKSRENLRLYKQVMFDIHFSPRGKHELEKLPRNIQERIVKKLHENTSIADPLCRAKPLINLPPATHRFRVGKYRISFYIEGTNMFIERVELRGGAYRK